MPRNPGGQQICTFVWGPWAPGTQQYKCGPEAPYTRDTGKINNTYTSMSGREAPYPGGQEIYTFMWGLGPRTPGIPGGVSNVYTFMWGPGAPTPGTPGGINTYTELCGARWPRHQGPRRVIHHAVKEGPGSPCTHRTPRGSQDIYRARHRPGKGLPRACQGLARDGGGGGREEGERFLFQKME